MKRGIETSVGGPSSAKRQRSVTPYAKGVDRREERGDEGRGDGEDSSPGTGKAVDHRLLCDGWSAKQRQIQQELVRTYDRTKQTAAEYEMKAKLRRALYLILRQAFPKCGLYMTGSSVTGLGTRDSDMDLCLQLSENGGLFKKSVHDLLGRIQRAFRLTSFIKDTELVYAKVSILKFRDNISGVYADLNIDNTVGIHNSHLLAFYCKCDWRLAVMVLFLKSWAKANQVNDAFYGLMSSYVISLLVVHYLQTAEPSVLPVLQQQHKEFFDFSRQTTDLDLLADLDLPKSQNTQPLYTLLLGFFKYYSSFPFDKTAVSVRLGRKIEKSEVNYPANKEHTTFMVVEEPFTRENAARSVYKRECMQRILLAFRVSHQTLEKKKCSSIQDIMPCI